MVDWGDYYSGQRVDSLARFVALRHHDARFGGSIPGLGSFNTATIAPKSVFLVCSALVGYSMFVANTVAVKNA